MKFFLAVIFLSISFVSNCLANDVIFFLESAYINNPKLKAERENLKAIKENINISKSDFLPSVTITGSIDSSESTNRTDQSGNSLADISNETETTSVSVDQKIFQGFEGYNSVKKSKLEVKRASLQLKKIEQEVILETATAYYDLEYKIKSKDFNLNNVDLFERQVESDKARSQKGEISLTDLSQSESSLAGAYADFIAAENDLLTAKTNFERITRISVPDQIDENLKYDILLPKNLNDSLQLSEKNNPDLIIAKLNYEISKKDVSIEKAKLSPSASLNYSRSSNDDFSATVDELEKESVKATVTWPLLKGGKNFSSLKKAKFTKNKNGLILDDKTNETKTNTANAWSLYQSAQSVLKSTEAQVKAAEIANEGITLEYDSGNTRTTLEVIQSRSLLLNARIANAKAKRDFMVSKFKLLSVIGQLSLEKVQNP